MGKKIDLTGQRFGRLVVVGEVRNINYRRIFLCECDCGKLAEVGYSELTYGDTKSCGCLRVETSAINGEKVSIHENTSNFIKNDTSETGTRITSLDARVNKNNTSGYKGVWFQKKTNRWIAEIMFKRKKYYLGSFELIEDAINARKEAEEKYFKPILDKYTQK